MRLGTILGFSAAVVIVGCALMLATPWFSTEWEPALVVPPSHAVPPPKPRELTEAEHIEKDWTAAYNQRNFPQAIELGLKLTELEPNNSMYAYNLACAYSLNAQPDEAAQWLARAADHGFSLLRLFETDSDLETMRAHVGYEAALAAVKKTRAAQLEALQAKFEQTPLHVVLPTDYQADRPVPLIVALHGKGSLAPRIANQWRKMAVEMGAIIVAPQAVVPHGEGFSWCEADTNDDLCDDAEFLVRLAMASVLKQYKIDPERVILTGFSEGGFVSQIIGPRPPYLFTGVIPMGCGYIREYDEPSKAIGDRPPRFFFMAAEHDHAFPVEQVHEAAKDYTQAGFPAKSRIYPKVGHQFPIKREAELRRALKFVMQKT